MPGHQHAESTSAQHLPGTAEHTAATGPADAHHTALHEQGSAPAATPGRPYGGRTQADRMAERRRRFIEAGIQVFGQQGYRAATVRGLCAQAGLTDRYFYESFDSVQSLLEAVYLHQVGRLRLGLRQMSAPPVPPVEGEPAPETTHPSDPWEAVAGLMHGGLSLWFDLVRDPLFARVVLVEVLGVGPKVDSLHEAAAADFAVFLVAPLQLLGDAMPGTDTERLLVGHALAGAAVQLGRQWLASGYRQPRDALVNSAVLVCMGALRALAAR